MPVQGPRLVLLGKQGAGKGTQAQLLADNYGVEHLSTGDMFRAAAAKGTPAGLEAKAFMDEGNLVPDDTVIRVVEERFTPRFRRRGFVLDGYPRTRPQAEALEVVLDGQPLDAVLDLEVPTEIVLDRIAGRRVCVNCGALYHVNMPPQQNWSCDLCGGHVVQRDDDTEEAVQRRLELYELETVPIIDFYRDLGKLVVGRRRGRGRRGVQAPRRRGRAALRPGVTLSRCSARAGFPFGHGAGCPFGHGAGRVITRKNPGQIALMRRAGRVVAEMHEVCIRAAKPGATTMDVDRVAA